MVILLLMRWLKVRLFHIGILEELDFRDIIVSLKASDVPMAIAAYTKAAASI